MFFFYVTLVIVGVTLVRLRFPFESMWLALAAIVSCPVYIFYTRAFLVESTALCASWIFLLGVVTLEFQSFTDPRRWTSNRWLFATIVALAATVASLTKITTFAVYGGAAILLWLAAHYIELKCVRSDAVIQRRAATSLFNIFVPIALALAVGIGWTRYTDQVKLANPSPMAHRLTSAALMDWNFGQFGMLLHVEPIRALYARFAAASVGSFASLGAVVLLFPFVRKQRWTLLAMLGAFLSAPLVFTNLYAVHDYYWYANSVFFAIVCGATIGGFIREHGRLDSVFVNGMPVFAFVVAQFIAYHFSYYHFVQKVPPHAIQDVVAEIKSRTHSDSSIVLFGFDWNPMIPYYAERHALMVPWDDNQYFNPGSQRALSNLSRAGLPVEAIIFGGPEAKDFALQTRVLGTLAQDFTSTNVGGDIVIFCRRPADHPVL